MRAIATCAEGRRGAREKTGDGGERALSEPVEARGGRVGAQAGTGQET